MVVGVVMHMRGRSGGLHRDADGERRAWLGVCTLSPEAKQISSTTHRAGSVHLMTYQVS